MIEDPNDLEELQNLPEEEEEVLNPEEEKVTDTLGDPIKEEEELEPVVQRLRSGYGRIRVIDKVNMVVFQYDYKIKNTELTKVVDYLTSKYTDCRLEVIE